MQQYPIHLDPVLSTLEPSNEVANACRTDAKRSEESSAKRVTQRWSSAQSKVRPTAGHQSRHLASSDYSTCDNTKANSPNSYIDGC